MVICFQESGDSKRNEQCVDGCVYIRQLKFFHHSETRRKTYPRCASENSFRAEDDDEYCFVQKGEGLGASVDCQASFDSSTSLSPNSTSSTASAAEKAKVKAEAVIAEASATKEAAESVSFKSINYCR